MIRVHEVHRPNRLDLGDPVELHLDAERRAALRGDCRVVERPDADDAAHRAVERHPGVGRQVDALHDVAHAPRRVVANELRRERGEAVGHDGGGGGGGGGGRARARSRIGRDEEGATRAAVSDEIRRAHSSTCPRKFSICSYSAALLRIRRRSPARAPSPRVPFTPRTTRRRARGGRSPSTSRARARARCRARARRPDTPRASARAPPVPPTPSAP